ncbi:MAG TPA: methyltransferase [Vicinamibacterales bacterium]|jgi:predicted O-methyltransferase YrrM|nr:methyltransferase [Vicinamibacterales bacterium]
MSTFSFPLPSSDPIRLYRYRDGLYAVDLLTAAIVHFDLFSWLDAHPSDFETLCREHGLAARPADVLVTLAAANGIVERRDGTIVVTTLGREHLTTRSPFNLAPYYASLKDRPVVQDFVRVLRTGKPAHWGGDAKGHDWHASMEQDDFARTFTAAMDCRGAYLGAALARHLDLSRHARLLDIGGGSGIYACALASAFPHLHATVFDQTPVDRIAARLIGERGFSDRVRVAAGNFFVDAWPDAHDVHLFSNVLHDWDRSDVDRLVQRSFDALPAGGLLIIHDACINADKTGPLPVAEYSAILMHSTQGQCYATSEYDASLTRAGFTDVAFMETVADRGMMIARKPGGPARFAGA